MEKKVLDKGYIILDKAYSSDDDLVRYASLSYGESLKSTTVQLIDHLIKRGHDSIFEFASMVFRVKAPLFVVAQWQRHRVGSFLQRSGRYTESACEFYVPQEFDDMDDIWTEGIEDFYEVSSNYYRNLIKSGIKKEVARGVLPQAMYTEFYWNVNLRSLFNFLKLRLHSSAQKEMRSYAEAVKELFKESFPLTFSAWEHFRQ